MDNRETEIEDMQSTKKQLLRDPVIEPSSDVIAEALGESNNAYIKFVDERARRDSHLGWRDWNGGKAWLAKGLFKWTGVRGGQNEKTVFWLSIWDGFFKVTIYVPEKSRADILSIPLGNELKQMISASKEMGKVKYFPIVFDLRSDEMLEAVFLIADNKRFRWGEER